MDPLLFAGKTAVITGASRGLGQHIAEAFWRCGADVFLIARSAPALAGVCAALKRAARNGQHADYLASDLSDTAAPERIIAAALDFSGRVDILLNNAGIIGPIGALDENDWTEWQRTIDVNLLAPAALCRLAIQCMKSQHGGAIVNVSGGGATSPRPFFSAYATAKAGLVRFTETIAAETGGMESG